MLHRCALRRASMPHAPGPSLTTRIQHLHREPSYLRRAPPSLYVTCDPTDSTTASRHARRHSTHLLDTHSVASSSSAADLPLTSAVCALRSTALEDVSLVDAAASSTLLVDVPPFTTPDAWLDFFARHETELAGLHTIVLTELQPYTSSAVMPLLAVRPAVRVCCSPFVAAALTDPTFFAAVKRAVLERVSRSPEAVRDLHERMPFAGLENGVQVRAIAHGETVCVDTKAADGAAARALTALHVSAAASAQEDHVGKSGGRRRSRRAATPAAFQYTPVFYHDPVLASVHVGSALVRVPWLPHVMPEVARDTVLPRPSLLTRRGARASASETRDGPLLRTWQVRAEASAVAATLRTTPTALHVLSSSAGALEGDVEDVCAGVTGSAESLEQLRSRLARRLETDTLRDPAMWTTPLLAEMVKEVLSTQAAHPATPEAVVADVLDWAAQPGTALHDVASALAYAAVVLPPSAPSAASAGQSRAKADTRSSAPGSARASRSAASTPTDTEESDDGAASMPSSSPSSDFEDAKGVTLLQAIFTKKGLHGLGKAAAREKVDVKVFLSMTPADFRRTFKTTPGVSRKLELLQTEIRQNLP